jgi:hypothetical protein
MLEDNKSVYKQRAIRAAVQVVLLLVGTVVLADPGGGSDPTSSLKAILGYFMAVGGIVFAIIVAIWGVKTGAIKDFNMKEIWAMIAGGVTIAGCVTIGALLVHASA